jgi:hypothetical protein
MSDAAAPGRTCPPHYGYSPRVLARAAQIESDVLYVVGGLYGNPAALETIERMASLEPRPPRLVFNGDFHWFDAERSWFEAIQLRVCAHAALRGNVETEIAADDDAAGCGCAYPDSVSDDDVERSNAILARLRATAATIDGARAALGKLPPHAVAQVGNARIALVHGDAWSLAGWRFAHDSLHAAQNAPSFAQAFELAEVDGFACSHTCAPALKAFAGRFVINNGAAGMANFEDDAAGLITRIAVVPVPARLVSLRAYGTHTAGVYVDALAVRFDLAQFLARFDAAWPAGSAACVSYRSRIAHGPRFAVAQALGSSSRACA